MCLWYRILNIQIVHFGEIQFGECVYNFREELNSKINKAKFDYPCTASSVQVYACGQKAVLTCIHIYGLWLKYSLGRKIINSQLNIHQYSLSHKPV
jgi:hypothetical protein